MIASALAPFSSFLVAEQLFRRYFWPCSPLFLLLRTGNLFPLTSSLSPSAASLPPRSLPDTLHASITALRQEDDRDVFCATNKADEEHFAKFSWVQVRWWVTLRQAPEWTWTVLTKKRNDDRVTFPSWRAPQSRRVVVP